MRPRARLIPYLGLVFTAYAVYSFMDEPLFEFLFFFLLLLPVLSLLLLFAMRRGLTWELQPLREEGRRLDDVTYVLKLKNRLPFFLPNLRFHLRGHFNPESFVLTSSHLLDQGPYAKTPPLETWLGRLRGRSMAAPLTLQDYQARESSLRPKAHQQSSPGPLKEGTELRLHLGGHEEATYELRYLPAHVGIERLDVVNVRVDDIFSFFTVPAAKAGLQTDDYCILPNPSFFRARIGEDLPDPQPVDVERWTDRIGNEVNALANIRAWRPGDRMKDIHWKVSAKSQEFMVKEFEDPRKGAILFLIDPYWPSLLRQGQEAAYKDELTEVCAALFLAMNPKEGPFTFRHLDQRLETPGQGEHPRRVERYLAGLRLRAPGDLEETRGLGQAYFEQLSQTRKTTLGPPSLAKMLGDEYKLESWRAIVVITADVGRPLSENVLRILRERTAQVIFVSAEPADYLRARFSLGRESQPGRPHQGPGRDSSDQILRRAESAVAEAEKLEHLSLGDLFDESNQATNPLALREESLRRFQVSGGIVFRAPFRSLRLPQSPAPAPAPTPTSSRTQPGRGPHA